LLAETDGGVTEHSLQLLHMTGCHNIHALLHGFLRFFLILKANQALILSEC
jgi:hypothetical protein